MRHLLAALFLLAGSSFARAQGLVQLVFEGEIDATGGARVEAEIAFDNTNTGNVSTLHLGVLLAERTSAVDFASLLARRLEQVGARVIWTGSTAPARGPASLFVEDTVSVGLRLGRGLGASITLCEDHPAVLKISPGRESPLGATLMVAAHTYQSQTSEPGQMKFDVAFEDKSDAADAAAKLVKTAIDKGWLSELEGHDAWRPGAMSAGATVTGFSVQLRSNADWRIDVRLAPRVSQH